jgi:hypothetical protein
MLMKVQRFDNQLLLFWHLFEEIIETTIFKKKFKIFFMKKLLFSALIAVSLVSSAFAASGENKKVSLHTIKAFESKFYEAENVTWKVNETFVKATFVLNHVTTEAFYSPSGEFIGTSQAIALDKIPTVAKRAIAKKYADYYVMEAIKFDSVDETAYFVSVENEKKSIVLKVLNYSVSIYKTTNK